MSDHSTTIEIMRDLVYEIDEAVAYVTADENGEDLLSNPEIDHYPAVMDRKPYKDAVKRLAEWDEGIDK